MTRVERRAGVYLLEQTMPVLGIATLLLTLGGWSVVAATWMAALGFVVATGILRAVRRKPVDLTVSVFDLCVSCVWMLAGWPALFGWWVTSVDFLLWVLIVLLGVGNRVRGV